MLPEENGGSLLDTIAPQVSQSTSTAARGADRLYVGSVVAPVQLRR